MTKGQRQDFLREIKRSLSRYLSILFIVLLGVAFFVGLRSSEPAMKSTSDAYLDQQNFMHIRVLGTLGLTEKDRVAIENVRGVKQAEGIYQMDVLSMAGGHEQVIQVFSVPEDIGQLYLTEGRLPLKENECVLDDAFGASNGFKIGDEITLYSGTEEALSTLLAHDTFRIVGFGKNPYYLTFERGSASVGNGSQAGFMAILKAEFSQDYYTQVYVTVDGAKEMNCYDQAYLDRIDEMKESISAIAGKQCEIRYDEVVGQAERRIEEAEAQLSDGADQLAEAWKQLEEGEKLLVEKEAEYQAGEDAWAASAVLIEEGKAALAAGREELSLGEDAYEEARIKVVALETVLEGAQAAYDRESELYIRLITRLQMEKVRSRAELEEWLKEYGVLPPETTASEPETASPEPETTEDPDLPETLELEPETPPEDPQPEEPTYEDPEEPSSEEPEETQPQGPEEPSSEEPEETQPQEPEEPSPEDPEESLPEDPGEEEFTLDPEEFILELEEGEIEAPVVRWTDGRFLKGAPPVPAQGLWNGQVYQNAEVLWKMPAYQNTEASRVRLANLDAGADRMSLSFRNTEALRVRLAFRKTIVQNEEEEDPASTEKWQEDLQNLMDRLARIMKENPEGTLTLDDVYAALDRGEDAMLARFSSYLSQQKEILDYYIQEVGAGRAQLNASGAQIREAKLLLAEKEAELTIGEVQLAAGRAQLDTAKEQLDAAKEEAAKGREELEAAQKEFDEKNADALAEIEKARREIRKVENPEWYVLGRDTIQTYVEFGQDAESIAALAQVFPALFFLVAALVSLTAMTRMVEEQRTLIGTMKALGYGKLSIMSKYLLYALSASLVGGTLGALLGGQVLPVVVITAYKIMYMNLMGMVIRYVPEHAFLAVFLAVGCTTLATFFACWRELMAMPAVLMRPPAPKQGKRVFLENIGLIWRHLNFNQKSTIRNLFRYKKRIFMTVFGIGGCMGLMLVGFGLRDSITQIVDNQYATIWTYQSYLDTDKRALPDEKEALTEYLDREKDISGYQWALDQSYDFETGGTPINAQLIVISDPENVEPFFSLHDRLTGEPFPITDEGVILTQKLATLLDVKAGDILYLKENEAKKHALKVTAVTEHYLLHYVYMSPALYRETFGKEPVYNRMYVNFTEEGLSREEDLGREMLSYAAASSVHLSSSMARQIRSMLRSLDLVVIVLIVSAGLLAYVVLYNLNSINIAERRRELATLKVLGFYDGEVAMYVYRENVILTVLGTVAGIFLGMWLHQYVIRTVEIDSMFFGREIYPMSYVYASVLTIVFALIVNASMYYQLRAIDMVESLKSVE